MPVAASREESHDREVEVIAVLERCIFESATDRPFSVWLVRGAKDEGAFRAVAELDAERWGEPGDTVRLVGRWVDDPRYGRQLRVASVMPHVPKDALGIVRWLAEQPGIGLATARKVVAGLGFDDDLMDRIAEDPSLLDPLPLTASQKRAVKEAAARFKDDWKRASVLEWCFRHGLGPAQTEAVFQAFGENAVKVLSSNPWALARLHGFGFLTADVLARRLRVDPVSSARLEAALVHALEEAAGEGHVFLPAGEWLERTLNLVHQAAEKDGYGDGQLDVIRAKLPGVAQAMGNRVQRVSTPYGERVYLSWLWSAEDTVRRWLQARRKQEGLLPPGRAMALAMDPDVRGMLDEVQVQAVVKALAAGASVLTGGPGTGKSVSTRAVLAAVQRAVGPEAEVLLAAPTGRAAKRLAEVTGCEAKTIHRLLEYHPEVGFRRSEERPLEGHFLIVDEMSMADLPLFAALVKAIPDDMPVLLVGDADQLPPVGPGAPFHEIVRKRLLPITRLERIYRQDAGGPIALAARSINQGHLPSLRDDERGRYRVRVFPRAPFRLPKAEREQMGREIREQMADAVVEAVRQLILEGWRPDDIQVLTPTKRGSLGTVELNRRLRPILNHSVRDPQNDVFRTQGGREIWLGDRVIQTVNDYELGVFNGEIGRVIEVNVPVDVPDLGVRTGIVVEFEDGTGTKTVEYWAGNVSELQLAYAATVHKAQGSEFPAVIFVLAWDAYLLLTRPMAYTGVSRARELLWMFLEDGALKQAVDTVRDVARNQAIAL